MHTLEPSKVDVALLPCMSFEDRALLPHTPGIYFVLNAEHAIQYLGRAKSLLLRWQNHHRVADFRKLSPVHIAYLTVTDPSLLPDIEQSLLAYFDPPLNRITKKRGSLPKGYEDTHVLLQPDLLRWAKEQPEGLAAMLRRLLAAEYARTRRTADATP